jgi:copper homeostasis protein CutC
MLDAYREANESRLRIFKDIDRQIKAAEAGGLSRKEIMLALKAGGISQSDIVSILRGYYRPLDISESVARRARDADHPIPKRDIMSIKREYLRQPLYDENAE